VSDELKQALCCICGTLRTCRRPRNYRPENRWLYGPVDRDWHRETGDLKCDECGRITTHAIITGDNHAERIREAATGWVFKCLTDADHQRIRQAWRQGIPQNPRKRHLWWAGDRRKAFDAGQSHFLAICKAEIPVPKTLPKSDHIYASDELVAPNRFHDVDLEDPETGLWWYETDCTDCLYRSNMIALDRQRDELKEKVLDIAGKISKLDARTVAELLAAFNAGDPE
jgi:hypothetical protein